MKASEIIEKGGCYCGKIKLQKRKFARMRKSQRTLEYHRIRQCSCIQGQETQNAPQS